MVTATPADGIPFVTTSSVAAPIAIVPGTSNCAERIFAPVATATGHAWVLQYTTWPAASVIRTSGKLVAFWLSSPYAAPNDNPFNCFPWITLFFDPCVSVPATKVTVGAHPAHALPAGV